MECPRCGGDLDRYTLGPREAVGCDSCGYVGVPVEHRGERTRVESWEAAVSRYSGAAASVTVETVDGDPVLEVVLDAEPDGDRPEPTVVRVEEPDRRLAAAFEAADGNAELACEICGSAFGSREALYEHLATHSGMEEV